MSVRERLSVTAERLPGGIAARRVSSGRGTAPAGPGRGGPARPPSGPSSKHVAAILHHGCPLSEAHAAPQAVADAVAKAADQAGRRAVDQVPCPGLLAD